MDFRRLLTVAILATALMLAYYNYHSFTNKVLITTTTIHQALAQVPPVPTPPEIDDEIIAGIQPPATDSQSELPQSATPPNTSIPPTPTIQITSHQDGSQVPAGELTIQGTSSDNQESNCQVYADVNDIAPLQNVTAIGADGGDDYSQWTFTYTQDYQLITQGANELTAKISCFDAGITATPLSEWHSINVTGVVSSGTITSTPAPTPTPTPTLPTTQTPTLDDVPGAGQGESFIPSPITPSPLPFATSEQSSGDLSQGGGEGDDEDDDDQGDDDGGGEDDDDDDGEGDDG
jgi:hypothetical protein